MVQEISTLNRYLFYSSFFRAIFEYITEINVSASALLNFLFLKRWKKIFCPSKIDFRLVGEKKEKGQKQRASIWFVTTDIRKSYSGSPKHLELT